MRRRLAAASAFFVVLAALLVIALKDANAQSLQDKIAQCAACHGEDGQSKDPKIPNIGGQPKLFVMYQLFFYREGRRKNPEMNVIAKELTDAELDAISAYVSKLPPSPARAAPDDARYQRGAKLAQERICASCPPRRPASRIHAQGFAGLSRRHPHRHAGSDAGNGARPGRRGARRPRALLGALQALSHSGIWFGRFTLSSDWKSGQRRPIFRFRF
jgi:cytochrome c553